MDNITGGIVTILLAVIGVATLAVIVSKSSNTSSVIASGGGAFSQILSAAVSPITGTGGFGANSYAPHF